eukprot:29085-Pelagococcus_subviridis.AAC.8
MRSPNESSGDPSSIEPIGITESSSPPAAPSDPTSKSSLIAAPRENPPPPSPPPPLRPWCEPSCEAPPPLRPWCDPPLRRETQAAVGRGRQVVVPENAAKAPGDAERRPQERVTRRSLALGVVYPRNLADDVVVVVVPAADARAAEADESAVRSRPRARSVPSVRARHAEVLLRQREVRVHERAEVVRGVRPAVRGRVEAPVRRADDGRFKRVGVGPRESAEEAAAAAAADAVAAAAEPNAGLRHARARAAPFLRDVRSASSASPASPAARGVRPVTSAAAAAAAGGRVREDERRRHLAGRELEVGPRVRASYVPRGGVVRARGLLRGVERAEPEARAAVRVADLRGPAARGYGAGEGARESVRDRGKLDNVAIFSGRQFSRSSVPIVERLPGDARVRARGRRARG